MIVIGIDIGLTGAAAMINEPAGRIALWDLATVPTAAGYRLNGRLLHDKLREWGSPGQEVVLWFEDIRPRPGDRGGHGNTMHSQGSLMRSRGIIEAVSDVLGFRTATIFPQALKKHYGLIGKEKAESRAVAARLFPDLKPALQREKDHNRAESLLIAFYGLRHDE